MRTTRPVSLKHKLHSDPLGQLAGAAGGPSKPCPDGWQGQLVWQLLLVDAGLRLVGRVACQVTEHAC